LIATVRATVDPVRPPAVRLPPLPHLDLEGQGYAERFARAYLSYNAGQPAAYQAALGAFLTNPTGDGLQLPASGSQSVLDAQVIAQQPSPLGGETYTVAAQTSPGGLVYLNVPVAYTSSGALEIAGYPALVGPPASSPQDLSAQLQGLPGLADNAAATVLERALGNYLAGHPSDLQADLAPGASVILPPQSLALEQIQSAKAADGGRTVYATIIARAGDGAVYTLTYQVDFSDSGGRPYVTSIENSPTSPGPGGS